MPNGGSDCCGTCWFNRDADRRSRYVHCEIRDEPIEDPFWTYCANHPARRPERDPIPIGPILEVRILEVSPGQNPYARAMRKPSPDSEEIRQHLLDLLREIDATAAADCYGVPPSVVDLVMWQLGEFREQRAVEMLQRLIDEAPSVTFAVAQQALTRITEGAEQDFPPASLSQPMAVSHPRGANDLGNDPVETGSHRLAPPESKPPAGRAPTWWAAWMSRLCRKPRG